MEIKLSPNDRQDIIDLLKYALEKKKKDRDTNSFPKYWEIRVPQLIAAINGKVMSDSIMRSTMDYGIRRKLWSC